MGVARQRAVGPHQFAVSGDQLKRPGIVLEIHPLRRDEEHVVGRRRGELEMLMLAGMELRRRIHYGSEAKRRGQCR
jgi:hypothetical protein